MNSQEFSFLHKLKMIRSMPNTPMQVGEGCTTYTPGSNVTQSDIEKVQLILGSLGVAQQVPEKLINPAGALAGCGPAFVSRLNVIQTGTLSNVTWFFADIHCHRSVGRWRSKTRHTTIDGNSVCRPNCARCSQNCSANRQASSCLERRGNRTKYSINWPLIWRCFLQVCSPGGSTICGVHELEKGGLRNALINAVEKAAEKNARLG